MSKSIHAVFSNRSDDWYTPDIIYKYLEKDFNVKKDQWFDPCPLGALEAGFNGLETNWLNQPTYINPPYSNIKGFVEKAIKQHQQSITSYFLNTDVHSNLLKDV